MAKISGHEFPISKIFSSEFEFSIPTYQRPYSWTPEEAGQLLEDIEEFMDEQVSETVDPYFLGSIVLIKEEAKPQAEVIDGQQRLTTLTILFACMVNRLEEDQARSLTKYVNEPGDLVESREPKPRLTLRERDKRFFREHIQEPEGLEALDALDDRRLSDPQKNIRANALHFRERLSNMEADRVFRLAQFMVSYCFLVVVSTPSMKSAYRIFSVLNDRGMDLLTSDILKADIIGAIPEALRDTYTQHWEDIEEGLGRDEFNDLFSHIRMIYEKMKLKRTVLDSFRESVLRTESDGQHLIGQVLIPYAEAFQAIVTAHYEGIDHSGKINEMLRWLNRIDNRDWIPPSMLFLHRHEQNGQLLSRFFRSVERLAASMFIRRVGVNERIERYANLMKAIEKEDDLWQSQSPLMLTDAEKRATVERLDGDLYDGHQRVRTYVLLRLDSVLSDGSATYEYSVITVEHVLPQTIRAGSLWATAWPDEEERQRWVHRIGNLVLLSRRKNTQAGNADFHVKKERYFKTRGGVSPFTLTTGVLAREEWTPAIVAHRQEQLLETLRAAWDI